MKAEIRAVLKGLQIAKELRVSKLWVQLDSKVLAEMLQVCLAWCMQQKFLLQQCSHLLSRGDWETKVTHCFREANQVADRLTNMGLMTNLGVTTLYTPPIEVREAILADCIGAA